MLIVVLAPYTYIIFAKSPEVPADHDMSDDEDEDNPDDRIPGELQTLQDVKFFLHF
jgi:hypothetical protein